MSRSVCQVCTACRRIDCLGYGGFPFAEDMSLVALDDGRYRIYCAACD